MSINAVSTASGLNYAEAAQKILADLGLDYDPKVWIFKHRKRIGAGKGGTSILGSVAYREGVVTKVVISIGRDPAPALNTVAHEARHIWQQRNAVWTDKFERLGGTVKYHRSTWTGTRFVPRKQTYRRTLSTRTGMPTSPEWDLPHEVDARAYARDAVQRLFGLEYNEAETYAEALQRLL